MNDWVIFFFYGDGEVLVSENTVGPVQRLVFDIVIVGVCWLWPARRGYSKMFVVLRIPCQDYFQL